MTERDAWAEAYAEDQHRLRTAPRPASVSDRKWAIFCAYMHERKRQSEIAVEYGVSVTRISQIVNQVADIICSSLR